MFTTWFSGEHQRYYGESLHRARIDHVGQCLREQRYLDVVVRDHVHEWLRFTRYLEARGLPLPASVHAATVHDYVAGRLPGRSASRGRFIWRRSASASRWTRLARCSGASTPRRHPSRSCSRPGSRQT